VRWWLHERPRSKMRETIEGNDRLIITAAVSKHRVFVTIKRPVLPDHQLLVWAKDDGTSLGVLQSRIHELWARAHGTQVRDRASGFRYTPTTCLETFPFPKASAEDRQRIADAASELDSLRTRWLDPPEWTREEVLEFPGAVDGPWERLVHGPDENGIGTVRYPRQVPRDEECEKKLQARTLTHLYNERPTWLDLAHRKLDETVFAAYGWPPDLDGEEILERLLALNLERTAAS